MTGEKITSLGRREFVLPWGKIARSARPRGEKKSAEFEPGGAKVNPLDED